MAGRMNQFDFGLSQFKHLSIFAHDHIVARLHLGWTENYFCTGLPGEVNVTAHEIGMKMRFENVFDFCTAHFSHVEIGLNFPERINDGGFAIAFDIISSLGEAARINLFYFHKDASTSYGGKFEMIKVISKPSERQF